MLHSALVAKSIFSPHLKHEPVFLLCYISWADNLCTSFGWRTAFLGLGIAGTLCWLEDPAVPTPFLIKPTGHCPRFLTGIFCFFCPPRFTSSSFCFLQAIIKLEMKYSSKSLGSLVSINAFNSPNLSWYSSTSPCCDNSLNSSTSSRMPLSPNPREPYLCFILKEDFYRIHLY